ncbi:MFS transporter [Undibacterium arcticum]
MQPTRDPIAGSFPGFMNYHPKSAAHFWSCKIGYALDAMDTQFLSFVIPTLIATWGITKGDAGLIGTVTLLTSALGGWLAGILSDRIGRVKKHCSSPYYGLPSLPSSAVSPRIIINCSSRAD